MWLKVAVAAPIYQSLSYALPDDFSAGEGLVGRRVLVHLAGRRITGYVLDLEEPYETEYEVKPILKFLDQFPVFHPKMVQFFEWTAKYYHSPIGMVIKAALPKGLTFKSAKQIVVLDRHKLTALIENLKDNSPFLELLEKERLSTSKTAALLKDRETAKQVQHLARERAVQVEEVLLKDKVKAKFETCCQLSEECKNKLAGVENAADFQEFDHLLPQFFKDLKLIERKTIYFIRQNTLHGQKDHLPQAALNKLYSGAGKALPSLTNKGLVEKISRRIFRSPFGGEYIERKIPEQLTAEQQQVITELKGSLEQGIFRPFLLYGVTGSGKTEVYLRAAQKTVALGRDVLVLVPEIALATQLESQFFSRFGGQVVMQHSGLAAGEKYDQWYNALSGKAKIVIGARSAVFSPLQNIGLIIVDEEHDSAFKQDDSFRYNGRDLAVLRGKLEQAVVLLGSATPSITSYHNAETGKYTLLTMKNRAGKQSLPRVKVVDIKKNAPNRKTKIFWPQLEHALAENYANNQQSMVLLNRRGFSSVMVCRDCGGQMQCRHCNVSLTYHKAANRLICHYCGFNLCAETVCEVCRSDKLIPVGFGTERVAEELAAILPTAAIARLDSDTTRNKREFLKTLKRMYEGKIDVMVGTQMIAKGHDFPGVTLVGVVYADSGLHMPDFRAGEKTFQLISQVTGRAGRGEQPGRVIIQTMQPEHYAISFAKTHQYQEFYQHELKIRCPPDFPAYPPLVRLLAVHIDGLDEQKVQETSVNICRYLNDWCGQNCRSGERPEILGPAPSPLERIKEKYRFQILVKAAGHELLGRMARAILAEKSALKVGGDTGILLDIDPENMM